MPPNLTPIRTALLSVSDKTNLVPFATALSQMGVRLISTGGTAKALADAGLAVTPVEQLTGFPEGLDGRVKTLHPKVHGGLLFIRGNPDHEAFCRTHNIEPIDLLVINLYPFQQTVARPGVTLDEAIENIDIGGPAMLRAAAKNHAHVAVVTSPSQYDQVLTELREHNTRTTLALRQQLALAVYAHTAAYDAAITAYLSQQYEPKPEGAAAHFPANLRLAYTKAADLRYGENPHQSAALYRDDTFTSPSIVTARQLHGKELSYNNINDAASVLETVRSLHELILAESERSTQGGEGGAAACIVKHSTPCGCARASTAAAAIDAAIAGDPLAAYGGILAINTTIDQPAAERLCAPGTFFEVLVAPAYTDDALATLRARWQNLRILQTTPFPPSPSSSIAHCPFPIASEFRTIPGGLLLQTRDTILPDPTRWTHAAGPAPTDAQLRAAAFLEIVCRAALSNAVVIGGHDPQGDRVRLFGVGAGQVDRLTSCRIAVQKAGDLARGGVAFSDAFFPFDDGPRVLIDAGVTTIVHPGGSKRDADTFALCNARGVTCLTTGIRHFRH